MAMRRLAFLFLPLSLLAVLSAIIGYFVWWEATHCVYCRESVDPFGVCHSPYCRKERSERALRGPSSGKRHDF